MPLDNPIDAEDKPPLESIKLAYRVAHEASKQRNMLGYKSYGGVATMWTS